MNDRSLIANLPGDACVEVPCLVDGTGVWPVSVGSLPPQCSAYIGSAIDAQALTVRAALEEDRSAIYQAAMTDPQIQARLDLDETWALVDELITAEAEWLPAWLRD
jgi:alpha-galactosidase